MYLVPFQLMCKYKTGLNGPVYSFPLLSENDDSCAKFGEIEMGAAMSTKDSDVLYNEMCRVVGKVVLEMRDLGQEPKHVVIAGVLRTSLANKKIKRSETTEEAMRAVVEALARK